MFHRGLSPSKNSYRMLVTDLDGTLLTGDKEILDADMAAIKALREIGIHITIATGRLYSGVEEIAQQIEVHDLVACLNGSHVVDTRTGTTVLQRPIPIGERSAIRQILTQYAIETLVFTNQSVIYRQDASELQSRFSAWSGKFDGISDIFQSPLWEESDDMLAVVAVGPSNDILDAGKALRAMVSETREVLSVPGIRGNDGFLMVRDQLQNKGKALRQLAQCHGLSEEEVVCVGDWVNDIPMLSSNARSYAMGGTDDWLQGVADHQLSAMRDQGGAIAEIAREVWDIHR